MSSNLREFPTLGIIKAADCSVSEGCTDLVSSLGGVRMTTEGVFIIEEAGPPDTAVKNHLSLFHVARGGYDTLLEETRS